MKQPLARVAIVLFFLSGAAPAFADLRFLDGDWRAQLSGFYNVKHSGHDPADWFATGSIEYEFPAYSHGKLGIRAYPLFYYPSKDDVWGFGMTLNTRLYQHKTFDGFFGELEGGGIWLTHNIEDNSTRAEFLLGAGLGYKFPDTAWDVLVKFDHLSNAGFGHRNAGANGIGLGVGFSF